jgi:hypothetical protein
MMPFIPTIPSSFTTSEQTPAQEVLPKSVLPPYPEKSSLANVSRPEKLDPKSSEPNKSDVDIFTPTFWTAHEGLAIKSGAAAVIAAVSWWNGALHLGAVASGVLLGWGVERAVAPLFKPVWYNPLHQMYQATSKTLLSAESLGKWLFSTDKDGERSVTTLGKVLFAAHGVVPKGMAAFGLYAAGYLGGGALGPVLCTLAGGMLYYAGRTALPSLNLDVQRKKEAVASEQDVRLQTPLRKESVRTENPKSGRISL